jgi:hypothetical protein
MSLSEFELERCKLDLAAFMKLRRPPPHIRPELDFGFRISGQSVELLEIRPDWMDETQKMERSFAKATWVRTENCWRVFWKRADLKWHAYGPRKEVRTLAEFLAVVNEDRHNCFFG